MLATINKFKLQKIQAVMLTLNRPIHSESPLKDAPFRFNPNQTLLFSLGDTIKALKVAADTKNLSIGKLIHAYLIITNQTCIEDDVIWTNSLINLYAKCDRLLVARLLFDRMSNRNVVSWSSIMTGYFHNGQVLEVLELFKHMILVDNLRPNEYVFATVFCCCSDSRSLSEGKQCHGYVMKSGLLFHQYVKNALVYMYSTCSEVDGAMNVLDEVPGLDVFTYNSILNGLLKHGLLREACEILNRMVCENVKWDNVTFVSVFGLCACLKDLSLGRLLHSKILKTSIEIDHFSSSAIIDMYGKCGDILSARKVFEEKQSKNVVSWTSIMAAYFQNGFLEESLNLFLDMEHEKIPPNEYTFAVLLNSSAGLSTLRQGSLLHARVEKSGFNGHIIVGNALINMYAKCGDIEAANEVFSYMIYRDCITWNAMISGFSHLGLGREALGVFHEMLDTNTRPNYVTFVGVLSACGHLGRVQEGFFYFNGLMKQLGIEPGLEHYTCIVGLLSKAGKLDEAEQFMKSSPVKWDVVAWRTLLSACHVQQNYSLGKQVAEIILKLDPNDVGTYLLLSNMHAKAKRWDGVVKIRKLMRDKNVKKEPGVSWIEIKNKTHVFICEDCQHPESIQIYEKVNELLDTIKKLGYVPDFASVTHDVEDEQKEYYLRCHSEKLAIAYGLMKTPSESPIRVIKNLRMCDDCHTAVKLISQVTNRIIIVRDANRFHTFRDGYCSCADYW